MTTALTFGAALAAGLVAGVFFAFSTFVMNALARLPAAQGIAAMQSINVTVLTPWFMAVFFGTALPCLLLVIRGLRHWPERGAPLLALGGVVYVVGVLGVTIACNVPRNDALAVLDPTSRDAAHEWSRYVTQWTMWNHVRGAAALATAALFVAALARRADHVLQ